MYITLAYTRGCTHASYRYVVVVISLQKDLPFVATESHQHVVHGHALVDLDDVSNSIHWERIPSLP